MHEPTTNPPSPESLSNGSETVQPSRVRFSTFPPHQRLCFYPSSSTGLLWAVMQMDCDLFVFSEANTRYNSWTDIEKDCAKHRQPVELLEQGADFVRFRCQGKTGLMLWHDNNWTLKQLAQAGLRVHHFVGICDGCCEGGNYECVHDRPFISKLLRLAADGMGYSTDHSAPLQYAAYSGHGMSGHSKFRKQVHFANFPEPQRWSHHLPADETVHDEHPAAWFELQGLLAYPEIPVPCVQRNGHVPETQLHALIPFRTVRKRGVLAEYRVWLPTEHIELDGPF